MRRCATRSALLAGAVVAAALGFAHRGALAQVTLSQDFDSGSLNVPLSTISGNAITLVGRRTWTSSPNSWRWINFRASGVNGLAPAFRITSSNFLGSLSGHRFVWSYDQQDWSFFDSGSTSGGFYNFSNAQPFAQDDVYVAYHFPYPVSRTAAHTMQVASSPHVTPAASTGGDFIIGQGAGGIDDTGRTIPPQNLYAYRVTDSAASHLAKKKVVLAGGNHSGEPMGNFILEGAVDWMLGDSARAALLRRHADTFVYPQVNPDGRYAGYYRSNPENPAADYNRYWDDPTGFTDLTQVRNAVISDTGGDVDYILDLHSFFDQGDDFVNLTSNLVNSPFITALRTYEPTIDAVVSSGDPGMLRIWGSTAAGLRAEFAYTSEMGPRAGRTEAQVLQLGATHARALFDAIVTATVKAWDLDADGAWETSANWVHGTPNAADHDVLFGPNITAPRTITVGGAHAAGSFTFDSDHGYTIGGPGAITLASTIDVVRGSHAIAAPIVLPGNTSIGVRRAQDVLSLTGSINSSGVSITKTGAGRVDLNHIRAAQLSIDSGAVRIRPDGTSAGTSRLNAIVLAGGAAPTATLDLSDNDLIIDYSGASPVELIADQIASARAGGDWSGPGITSGLADGSSFALGVAESAAIFTSFPATFSGQSVDDTAVLVAFTRYGDANLDGQVNLTDFNTLAANFGQADRMWWQADFNYDSLVNLADFNLLAQNFGLVATGPDLTPQDWAMLASSVPEPSTGLVALAAVFSRLARARRRRAR
jgi:hypothetical protein